MGCVAGEDVAGRAPQAAEQAPPPQTQAQTTTAWHGLATGQPGEAPAQAAGAGPSAEVEQPGHAAPPAGSDRTDRPGNTAQLGDTPQPTQPTDVVPDEQSPPKPGFGERGRMRRRARFLRKARELAYRDLGGLVYDLHRFGQRNDAVVLAKLATLGHIDAELRALEQALHEIRPVTVLREVGIAACPRCAAIHGNEDRYCPGCGLAFAAGADRPLSTAPVTGAPGPEASAAAAGPPIGAAASSAASAAPTPLRPAAAEPLTTLERPHVAQSPPLRPTVAPVAARPPAPQAAPAPQAPDVDGKRDYEEEPTQVLRPPAEGA
jgi:hypothetical protein